MTPQVHPGLPINTPHGVGVVVCVRHDGMVVTQLASSGGGPGFTGYFHPSAVDLLPFGYGGAGGGVQGSPAGFVQQHPPPSSASSVLSSVSSPSVGMFQPVSPMDCGRFEAPHMGLANGANKQVSGMAMQPALQQGFRALDRPKTPPPSKRRRSAGGFVFNL